MARIILWPILSKEAFKFLPIWQYVVETIFFYEHRDKYIFLILEGRSLVYPLYLWASLDSDCHSKFV